MQYLFNESYNAAADKNIGIYAVTEKNLPVSTLK
jgi:hypothetical protein